MSKEILLYGQRDYVSRIKSYINLTRPKDEVHIISFPIHNEKTNDLVFDFSVCDYLLKSFRNDIKILVAFSLRNNYFAKDHLKALGFNNLVFYDSYMDNKLKSEFFSEMYKMRGSEFITIKGKGLPSFLEVYMAKTAKDNKFTPPECLVNSPYIIPIQVGAALTNERIADVIDSTGDNISNRNAHYSEMTAFYWMWKNSKAKYIGLCHYRRFWLNLSFIAEVLHADDLDAVLPLPTLCQKSVYDDYLLKYIPTVWKPMMDVMKEQSPEYYEAAQLIFKDKIFYASNMCILKREVLNDLCEWMFPIVMEVEKIVGDIKDPYFNRYAGFCTERLITLYFIYNKHSWKIAHAEKVFVG